jgi:hypothetical protein
MAKAKLKTLFILLIQFCGTDHQLGSEFYSLETFKTENRLFSFYDILGSFATALNGLFQKL